MKYTLSEFTALIEAVEDAGGEHLDENHTKVWFNEWVGPNKQQPQPVGNNCGQEALFHIPYKSIDAEHGEINLVKACAADDDIGKWPRFAGVIEYDPEND